MVGEINMISFKTPKEDESRYDCEVNTRNKIKLGEGRIIDQKTGRIIATTNGGTATFVHFHELTERQKKQRKFIEAMTVSAKYIGGMVALVSYFLFVLNVIGWLITIRLGFLA